MKPRLEWTDWPDDLKGADTRTREFEEATERWIEGMARDRLACLFLNPNGRCLFRRDDPPEGGHWA